MCGLETFLAERGKRAIGWDEIVDIGPGPATVVASWQGMEGGAKAAAAGNDVILCPLTHCYLDYRIDDTPGQVVGAAHGKVISLETCYGFDPLGAPLRPEDRARVLGVQGNLWTEYMWTAEDVDKMAFPRLQALAELGWTPAEQRDWAGFQRRLGAGGARGAPVEVLSLRE